MIFWQMHNASWCHPQWFVCAWIVISFTIKKNPRILNFFIYISLIYNRKTSIVPLNGIWYIELDRTSNYPLLFLVDNVLN
jgi:hypothetical protein